MEELCNFMRKKVKLEPVCNDVYMFLQDVETQYSEFACSEAYSKIKDPDVKELIQDAYMCLRKKKGYVHIDICKTMAKTPFWLFTYDFSPNMIQLCPLKVLADLGNNDTCEVLDKYDKIDVENMLIDMSYIVYPFSYAFGADSDDKECYKNKNIKALFYRSGLKELIKVFPYMEEFTSMSVTHWVDNLASLDCYLDPQLIHLILKKDVVERRKIETLLHSNASILRFKIKGSKNKITTYNLNTFKKYINEDTLINDFVKKVNSY
jgi:hypothetical protein